MKVLLINPPQTFYPGSDLPAGNLPLGLLYVAAVLEEAGFEVEVLDAFMTDVVFRRIGDSVEIGMSYDKIREEIQFRNPDVIGIANPFTCQTEHAARVAAISKATNHRIITVVGGPHVSVVPMEFLEEATAVDIVVIGEGEYTMLEIAEYAEGRKNIASIKGIAYRIGNKFTLNPPRPPIDDLDELPFPAYHLLDMERYLSPKNIEYRSFKDRAISMITSRGCPFNCCFCSVHLHMGKKFRANSADYVLKHIKHVIGKYRIKTVFFEDDNLTFDLKRFERICDRIIEEGIRISWETPNGIRADGLTMPLLEKMKASGCNSVFFGIESGNQNVLDRIIGKNLNLRDVLKVARMCKKIGLKTAAFYIIGFPGEKKEDMIKTVELALTLKKEFDVGMLLHVATPSLGTRLYEECKKRGFIREDITARDLAEVRQTWGMPIIQTDDFTPEEVREIALMAVRKYKRLLLLSSIQHPVKTLKEAIKEPKIAIKFLKTNF